MHPGRALVRGVPRRGYRRGWLGGDVVRGLRGTIVKKVGDGSGDGSGDGAGLVVDPEGDQEDPRDEIPDPREDVERPGYVREEAADGDGERDDYDEPEERVGDLGGEEEREEEAAEENLLLAPGW